MTDLSRDLLNSASSQGEGQAIRAVVLAGGRGTRLAPFTTVLPKPLMPIGESSILEIVLGQLEACGISDVTLCVGYLSHLIKAVISDRVSGRVNITYVHEKEALGTAGPLRFVEDLTSTFLVMNGDVLTTIRYDALVEHHRKDGNLLTIATRERPIKIDYGVLHLGMNGSSNRVFSYHEKPELTSVVSMGIYVLEPEVLSHIPEEGPFDFPTLVQSLLAADLPVGAYPYEGLWFDIGQRSDYERAVEAWMDGMAAVDETENVEPGTGRA